MTVLCFDPAFVSNTNFRQLIVVDMVLVMVVTVCGDYHRYNRGRGCHVGYCKLMDE